MVVRIAHRRREGEREIIEIEGGPSFDARRRTMLLWERLLESIELSDNGCWLWVRPPNTSGYGYLKVAGKNTLAHRASYETFEAPIPADLHIDHLCRVRHCINPAHMEPVTCQVNVLRGETMAARNSKVTHCPRGHEYTEENTGHSSQGRYCRECRRAWLREYKRQQRREAGAPEMLRPADVLEIRALYGSGATQQQLADRFGVSRSNISYIVRGKSWSHVGGDSR